MCHPTKKLAFGEIPFKLNKAISVVVLRVTYSNVVTSQSEIAAQADSIYVRVTGRQGIW